MNQKKVVIIGAGIGGIATANLLAKAGYAVTVLEKNEIPGGRAGIMKKDGFTFDTGPSWYLMPKVFEQYYQLFDTSASQELDLVRLSPAYKVFFESHAPITITSDEKTDQATFEAIEPRAGEKLHTYITKGTATYDTSLRHFLYTNFQRPVELLHPTIIRRGLELTLKASTSLHRYVARSFSDQRLQQILEYPMVFLGSSPYQAPAIYSLMSALDFKEGVFYPRGGMYTIIESLYALSRTLGVTYEFAQPVARIEVDEISRQATGVTTADGVFHPADYVISNADLHFTETQLVPKTFQSYPAEYWSTKQSGPSALLLYLGVSGSLPTLEHHNLFFVDDWKENFEAIYDTKQIPDTASIYLCKPSATDDTVAPADHENIFVLVPLPSGITPDSAEVTAMTDRFLLQIEAMTGIADLRERIVSKSIFSPNDFTNTFNAWQGTALGPSHVLRQSAVFRTPNKSKKVSNLFYTGGFTVPGVGLPMCLIGAELTYKRIAGIHRGGPLEKRDLAKRDQV